MLALCAAPDALSEASRRPNALTAEVRSVIEMEAFLAVLAALSTTLDATVVAVRVVKAHVALLCRFRFGFRCLRQAHVPENRLPEAFFCSEIERHRPRILR